MGNLTNLEIYLAQLAKAVEQKKLELQQYQCKPNPNKFYLEKETEFINAITNSHNGIEQEYRRLQFFEGVANHVISLVDHDHELGFINVKVQVRPDKSNIGLVIYNPFGDD